MYFSKKAEDKLIKSVQNTDFGDLPDRSETNLWLTDAMIISRMNVTIIELEVSVFDESPENIWKWFIAMRSLWDFLKVKNMKESNTISRIDKYFDGLEMLVSQEHINIHKARKIMNWDLLRKLRLLKCEIFAIAQNWGFGTRMQETYIAKKGLKNAIHG